MAHLSSSNGNMADIRVRSSPDDVRVWDDSQPTPAQRTSSDSSQTYVKQVFVSEGQRIEINELNVTDIFENLDEKNSEIVTLQDLYNKHAKSEFISMLIANQSSDEARCEIELEQLRDVIFSEVRGIRQYPFPVGVEMKRRVRRSRGETIAFKLASDIYQLISILDGGSFDGIQNMLSIPKTHSRPEFNSSMCGTQKNASNIDVLSTTVTQIQSDLIKVKQNNVQFKEKITEDLASFKNSLSKMQHNNDVMFETLKSLIGENTQSIDRVSSERSSGVAKIRSDIKVMWSEISSNQEEFQQHARESRETLSNHTKTVEKRIGRLEQRYKSINVDNSVQKVDDRPDYISVGTQVHETDLGVEETKCCAHVCARSISNNEARDLDKSGESVLIVSDNLPGAPDSREPGENLYTGLGTDKFVATRLIGTSTPSLGGQLIYTAGDRNVPRFIRHNGMPIVSMNGADKTNAHSQIVINSPPRTVQNSVVADRHRALSYAAGQNLPNSTHQSGTQSVAYNTPMIPINGVNCTIQHSQSDNNSPPCTLPNSVSADMHRTLPCTAWQNLPRNTHQSQAQSVAYNASMLSLNGANGNSAHSQSVDVSPPGTLQNSNFSDAHLALTRTAWQNLRSNTHQSQAQRLAENAPALSMNGVNGNNEHLQRVENSPPCTLPNSVSADMHRTLPRTAWQNMPSNTQLSQAQNVANNAQMMPLNGANVNSAHSQSGENSPTRNLDIQNAKHRNPPRTVWQILPNSTQQSQAHSGQNSVHVQNRAQQNKPAGQNIPTHIGRTDDTYKAGDSSGQDDIDDFILHVRKKVKRFYVGRFTPGITEQSIRAFIKDKNGPKVDKIDFFNPKNGSDVFLRICVDTENSDVLTEPGFWPDDVRCHPWYSRNAYRRNVRQSNNVAEDQSADY